MVSLGLDTNGSHLGGGGWCGVVLSALQVPKVVVSVNQSSGGGISRAMGSNDECNTREPNTYRTQHHQHHHPALSRGVQSGEVDSTHLTAVRPQCRQNAQTRSYAGPGWVVVTIDELRTVYVGAAIRQRAYGRSLYSHCPFINDKGCWALFDEFHAHDGCRRSHERPPGGSRR